MIRTILALDPATRTGFAWSDGQRIEHGVWLLRGNKLQQLREYVMAVAGAWGVELIAYEDAPMGSRNRNTMAFHSQLGGVIQLCAADLGIEARRYNPLTIKKWFTGSGRASKDQMVRAARTHFGIDCTEDEADALAVLNLARQGHTGETRKQQARRVAKVVKRKQGTLFDLRKNRA